MECFSLNLELEPDWRKGLCKLCESQNDVANYIVDFYNATRLHS